MIDFFPLALSIFAFVYSLFALIYNVRYYKIAKKAWDKEWGDK